MNMINRTRVGVTHLRTSEIEAGGIVGGVGIEGLTTAALGNSRVISGNGIKVAVPVTGIASVSVRIPLAGCS